MLIQHLLTERLMRNPELARRNVIAAQVKAVIEAIENRRAFRDREN